MGTYATQIPSAQAQRRVQGAGLAECQQSGASVAAIALAYGFNVNLLRKWLMCNGINGAGLTAPDGNPRGAGLHRAGN